MFHTFFCFNRQCCVISLSDFNLPICYPPLAFWNMALAYRLNKYGDKMQPCHKPFRNRKPTYVSIIHLNRYFDLKKLALHLLILSE